MQSLLEASPDRSLWKAHHAGGCWFYTCALPLVLASCMHACFHDWTVTKVLLIWGVVCCLFVFNCVKRLLAGIGGGECSLLQALAVLLELNLCLLSHNHCTSLPVFYHRAEPSQGPLPAHWRLQSTQQGWRWWRIPCGRDPIVFWGYEDGQWGLWGNGTLVNSTASCIERRGTFCVLRCEHWEPGKDCSIAFPERASAQLHNTFISPTIDFSSNNFRLLLVLRQAVWSLLIPHHLVVGGHLLKSHTIMYLKNLVSQQV
jgi:hypothetical protein